MRKHASGLIPEDKVALATDLYQLTMSRGYREMDKQDETAAFDLFVRKLPKNRSYMVVAGLEQALWFLTEGMKFDDESVSFLKGKKQFRNAKPEFWDYLGDLKFTGDVHAMKEGELAFGNEPMMRVTAPIIEAQLAETYLLSTYNHQTKVASKGARVVQVAGKRPVIEFGTRRTDPGAAVRSARAAYVSGAVGSSNVLADMMFGIPSFGTHAHSWIMSFPSEREAFEAYFKVFGDETVALIDTYDTITGARRAAALPGKIKGVRLDSGDMAALSIEVREILDVAGKRDGIVFASSDLNEYKIVDLDRRGAKIDAFGVGTELTLSADAPALGGVYKLSMLNDTAKLKLSEDKATYPGLKQVYRVVEDGALSFDSMTLQDEKAEGRPLLKQMVRGGKILTGAEEDFLPSIQDSRDYAISNYRLLPVELKRLEGTAPYKVGVSDELAKLTKELSLSYGKQKVIA